MEKDMQVNGKQLTFATTYDGDSQYNVEVTCGKETLATFKIAAEEENDVFTAALAHVNAEIELGNVKL